jgi:GGDEF domain-containing protein
MAQQPAQQPEPIPTPSGGASRSGESATSSRATVPSGVRTLNRTIRGVLSAAGIVTLSLLAVTMWFRGVDRVEVLAAALYIMVFAGVIFADVIGGGAAALLAAAIYMVVRVPALEVLGTARFAGLNLIRLLSYLAFGLIGGFAWKLLKDRLDKLETFDTIDDTTHLLNARGLFDLIDHEMARGRRYDHSFSIATVSFPAAAFATGRSRTRRRALEAFGETAKDAVRTTDRIGFVRDDRKVTLAVFCPETDRAGATIVLNRVGDRVLDTLLPLGVGLSRKLDEFVLVFPQESVEIAAFKDDLIVRTRKAFPDAR